MAEKLNKTKLKPVVKTITTEVGSEKKLVTMQKRYWTKPEENVAGLKKIGLSDNAIAIVNKLLEHTENVFVVGGAVRDLLMGKKAHDFDLATDLKPEQVIDIFGDKFAKTTGNVFPTVRVRHGEAELEVSTFRKEISSGVEGDRNAFKVEFSDNIADDLKRRDLTINALAINAKTGDVVDAFGGADDLKKGIIRFVDDAHERLREDPLRYLRAIRFKLRIGGEYAPETKAALSHESVQRLVLQKVSSDRIREEILKGVAGIENFSGFFTDLHEFGMLDKLFPEVSALVGHDGGPWHAEDVFTHSMDAGDKYGPADPEDKRDVLGKLSAYVHDIGKPAAYDKESRSFLQHEDIGAEMVPDFLKRFRFSNDEVKLVQEMIQNHMRKPTTMKGVRKIFVEMGDNVQYLMKLAKADTQSNRKKTPEEVSRSIDLIDEIGSLVERVKGEKDTFMKMNVNGHDIMTEFNLKPGPHMKDMLAFANDLVLEDPANNNKDFLLHKIKERFNLG